MRQPPSCVRVQRGVTLIVGLIMLVMITLLLIGAMTLSTGNLKAVGNMQFRDEAVSAANAGIEEVISSTTFLSAPPASPIAVDLNNDGTTDYTVSYVRTCIRAMPEASSSAPGGASSVTLSLPTALAYYQTIWDIDATVTNSATGVSVQVREGVHMRLDQNDCDNYCPPDPANPPSSGGPKCS